MVEAISAFIPDQGHVVANSFEFSTIAGTEFLIFHKPCCFHIADLSDGFHGLWLPMNLPSIGLDSVSNRLRRFCRRDI